ncbi:MAG: hypothetical protein ACYSTY_01810 [Planctomycetota bacterium]
MAPALMVIWLLGVQATSAGVLVQTEEQQAPSGGSGIASQDYDETPFVGLALRLRF